MKQQASTKGRRRQAILGGIGLLFFLGILVLMYQSFRTAEKHKAWLSDEVSLSIAAVLTTDSPILQVTPLKIRLFQKLPEWVRLKTYKWLDYTGMARYDATGLNGGVKQGQVSLHLQVHIPKQWRRTLSHAEITEKLNALKTDDRQYLWARLNYGNGFYSRESQFNFGSGQHENKETRYFIEDLYFNVPANLETFTLELYWPAKQITHQQVEPARVVATLPVKNPLKPVDPLPAPAGPLPLVVAKGDVEVILHHFLKRAGALEFNDPKPERAVGLGQFPRLPVDQAPHYSTVAVFEIRKDGQTVTDWLINDVAIHYGKQRFPYPDTGRGAYQAGKYQVMRFRKDLGALEQAVEMDLQLVWQGEPAHDEVQRLELPLPPQGFKGEEHQVKFWNGPVNVWLTNKLYESEPVPTSPFNPTIAVTRPLDEGIVAPQRVALELADTTKVDLSDYLFQTKENLNGWGYIYDTQRALSIAELPPDTLDKGSTVVVELMSPRRIDNLTILAEPTNAPLP